MQQLQEGQFASRTVLVVEDEFYLADDLKRALTERGANVAGPVATVSRARAIIDGQRVDFAVLDVNLKGEMIFPFADELRDRGVPFAFTTGYDATAVPTPYRDVQRWEKPVAAHEVAETIMTS